MSINKILVLGKTGEGKSTLCNYILNYSEKKCKESSLPGSCTKTVDGFISNSYKDIFMIDTPGLSDSKGEDQEIINRINEALKEKHCKGIKSIIFVNNINKDRLDFDDKRLLLIYCKMFPFPEFWYHVGILFSKSYEYFPEEALKPMKIAKQNDYLKDLIQTVEENAKEINKNLPQNKQIQVPGVFQTFYTDCGSVIQGFNHDRTDKEINRLINWTRGNSYLEFPEVGFDLSIEINYKSKERIDDRIELKEEIINEKETKIITLYTKAYKVKDFYDKDNIIFEDKAYKKIITYKIKEEWEKTDDENNKKVTIKWKRYDEYDENHKLIQQGTPIKIDTHTETKNSHPKEIPLKDPKYHVNYRSETIYKNSQSAVHEYFQSIKESPIYVKIFWGIENINPLFLAFNLGCLIVSKFKKKERWRIVERYYRDEKWETIVYFDEDGKEKGRSKPKLVETKELPMEIDEPVRID